MLDSQMPAPNLTLTHLNTLTRPDVLDLTRLVAALNNTTTAKLTNKIAAKQGHDEIIGGLARSSIPAYFRTGLYSEITALKPAARAAVTEAFFPSLAKADNGAAGDLTSWTNLLRDYCPGLDPSLFDLQGFDKLPDWNLMRFLVLRHYNDDFLRMSYMTIRPNPKAPHLPVFQTLRRNELGENKIVQGIVLKSGADLYTIGQLSSEASLRFARLRMSPAAVDTDKPRINLHGLRLGGKEATRHAFSHIMFGRQLRDEVFKKSIKSWVEDFKSGLISSTNTALREAIPEIDSILPKLKTEQGVTSIEPATIN